jgi:CRP-like cAMP-binding protein
LLPKNRLLAQLSPEELRGIQPYLESVPLPKGKVLFDVDDRPRYAYFPVRGLLSILAATESGGVLEVAMVCADGFVGVPIICQAPAVAQVRVQSAGDAYRLRAEILLKEFRKGGPFQAALLGSVHGLLAQAAQAAICLRYHSVVERVCRWVLIAHDGLGSDTIDVTQEGIAQMLGIPRSAVSTAAAALQDHGVIRQRHGRIQILNRRGLQHWTCECYAVLTGAEAIRSLGLTPPSGRPSTSAHGSAPVAGRAPPPLARR